MQPARGRYEPWFHSGSQMCLALPLAYRLSSTQRDRELLRRSAVPSFGLIDPRLCVPESHKSRIIKGQRAEKGGLISVPGCEQRAAQLIKRPR